MQTLIFNNWFVDALSVEKHVKRTIREVTSGKQANREKSD